MKIFVEAHTILKNRSGVGWFTHGMTLGLQSALPAGDSIQLLTHPREPIEIDDLLTDLRTFDRPLDWIPARAYHALKFRNKMPPIDLLYGKGLYIFPNFIRWPLAHSPSVIVVHDLSMFDVPDYSSPENLKFMTRHLPESIAKADMIVAVSNSTKQVLLDKFGVDPHKVIVAHLATQKDYYRRDEDEIARAKGKYGIFGKYLFFLSTLEPRKNVEGLVQAYCQLPKKLRDEYSLVLVGGRGWKDDGIQQVIAAAREAGERIIRPGYVDQEDLPALYSGGTAFVLPSHYEGFGLPVLEALSCGLPVLTANNSSLPETAGSAALYVDSTDIAGITSGMKELLTNSKLRADLTAKGYKQAKKFSWETTAQKIVDSARERNLL